MDVINHGGANTAKGLTTHERSKVRVRADGSFGVLCGSRARRISDAPRLATTDFVYFMQGSQSTLGQTKLVVEYID